MLRSNHPIRLRFTHYRVSCRLCVYPTMQVRYLCSSSPCPWQATRGRCPSSSIVPFLSMPRILGLSHGFHGGERSVIPLDDVSHRYLYSLIIEHQVTRATTPKPHSLNLSQTMKQNLYPTMWSSNCVVPFVPITCSPV